MDNNLFALEIVTNQHQEFVEITEKVQKKVEESNVLEGIVLVYCPHTTAGITINENADPDVVWDMIDAFNSTFPVKSNYKHFEGNSHAHIKSSVLGNEKSLIISDGKLLLGGWQGIYFCEFDGPRNRKVFVKVL
jgi:secondary thiamine-phosphate synthase enzyme